jgi:hypothetical protein
MDEDKVVAAILSGPIISTLGGTSGDIPPEVAVSIYEEVLTSVRKLHEDDD